MVTIDKEIINKTETHNGSEENYEEIVINLFRKVLSCSVPVGPSDNFFALGGNSFRGMKMASEAAELGYELSLKDIIVHPVVKDLAKVMRLKESSASHEKQQDSIIKKWEYEPDDVERAAIEKHIGWQSVDSVYPLTSWERETYRFTGTEAYFNTNIRFIYTSDIRDIQHLKDRFSRMCAVRQCLRTVMVIPVGSYPVKVVLKESDNELFYVDMRKQRNKVEKYTRTLQKMMSARGLDQIRPLIICGIVRTGENDYKLLIIKSHFILDGIGSMRFISELMGKDELLPDDDNYRSYYSGLEGMNSGEALKYWNDLLDGIPGICMLPRADESMRYGKPLLDVRILGRETGTKVNEYCRNNGISVSAFMCAALGKNLTEYFREDRLFFLLCGSGRPASLTSDPALMGNFVSKFPFVYSRGDTPQDCQRQLAESIQYQMTDTALLFDGQELSQDHCRAVVLDVLDFSDYEDDMHKNKPFINPESQYIKPYNASFIVNASGNYELLIHLDPDICDPESAVMIAEGMKKAIEIILKQ